MNGINWVKRPEWGSGTTADRFIVLKSYKWYLFSICIFVSRCLVGHSPQLFHPNINLKYLCTHDLFGVAGCIAYHGDFLSRVATNHLVSSYIRQITIYVLHYIWAKYLFFRQNNKCVFHALRYVFCKFRFDLVWSGILHALCISLAIKLR